MKTAPALKIERNFPAARAKPLRTTHKVVRERILDDPAVTISGSQYRVDLGAEETPRWHTVSKDKTCSCGAPDCAAIDAVRSYLQAGGARAPDALPPCPICGAKTTRDRTWDGRYTHQPGWRCEQGGLRHFLEAKAARIRRQLDENPWAIPPAPGYPGVLRDELMTWDECAALSRQVYMATGYDPTA